MGDAGLAQAPEQRPHTAGGAVRPAVGEVAKQGAAAPQHQQRVLLRGRPGADHLVGQHAGPLDEERQEGLVLDLRQQPERDRGSGVAKPDPAPHRDDQPGVLGIAPVDLDQQRVAGRVGGVHQEDAVGLAVRRTDRCRRDADALERQLDIGQARPAPRGSEGEVHDGCRHDRDQPGRNDGRRKPAPERQPHGRQYEQPMPETPRRLAQLRRGGEHRRRRHRESERRGPDLEATAAPAAAEKSARPATVSQDARQRGKTHHQHGRHHEVAHQHEPAPHRGGDHQRQRPG